MDQAKAPLPAEPERRGDVAVNRHQSAQEGTFQVASTQKVGDAMIGWDTDWQGGLWAPASHDVGKDLPPLQLQDQDTATERDRLDDPRPWSRPTTSRSRDTALPLCIAELRKAPG